MARYFKSRLIYFHRGVKIKPESEISCHNTLTSVISGFFHTRYFHYHSYSRVTLSLKLVIGATHTPADIIAAALTLLSRYTQRNVAVKTLKISL